MIVKDVVQSTLKRMGRKYKQLTKIRAGLNRGAQKSDRASSVLV